MKIENVAKRCGFTGSIQFFTAFHQATGMTPTDYRRTMGQESGREISSTKVSVLADFSADSAAKKHS